MEFIRVDGRRFMAGAQVYRFVGINAWGLAHLAAPAPLGDRSRLARELDSLASRGISNLRLLAGSEGRGGDRGQIVPAMQPDPGCYRPELIEGLDVLLAEMAEREMRAVLCLSNFWWWSGGFSQYRAWAGATEPPRPASSSWEAFERYAAEFFADEEAMRLYDAHVEALVGRENRHRGRLYREDPVIMAFELANEPRGKHRVPAFRAWVERVARRVKQLAPRQLVTVGSEGSTARPWCAGLDPFLDHRSDAVDYLTAHVWIENWGWFDPKDPSGYPEAEQKALDYIAYQARQAESLGKPLVVEEFGVARDGGSFSPASPTRLRDRFTDALLSRLHERGPGAVSGANLWAWSGEARPPRPGQPYRKGDPFTGDPPHEAQGWYSVYESDESTLEVLARHSRRLSAGRG